MLTVGKIIKEVEEKKLENLQNDLEKLREKQHKLSALSIAEVLRDFSVGDVFSEKVQANKLIVFYCVEVISMKNM